ncbi:TPA: hypothetical protein ACSVPQ_002479 [Clostridioides difficile]|uniref:Uncharacterized protein n=2 Tax=Clostridioides difficile TaxID=1496 RepID=A0AAN5VQ46_CLODI|nr:hypothetical protein [Clostridioides difficile]EGT3640931.1 hypothetical protein [Clostridioides difficile]EGT3944124.1 hypothetical protein [Clostridioides difficile]MBG0198849.1 hypothetical protein [Clostridioides difficile]MBH7167691.1 hypothetical protein [Clostridioides difficile]MBH7846667.1 hypothetical protein [Clostridioides difficile]
MKVLDEFQMKENISLIAKVWDLFKNDLLGLVKSTDEDISTKTMTEMIKSIKERLELTTEEIKVIDKWTICFIEGCKKYDAKIIKIMDMTIKKIEEDFHNN